MGRNPYKMLPTLRAVVQGAYVAFFLLAGFEFHLFYADRRRSRRDGTSPARGGGIPADLPPSCR